eukprot:gene2687-4608_t
MSGGASDPPMTVEQRVMYKSVVDMGLMGCAITEMGAGLFDKLWGLSHGAGARTHHALEPILAQTEWPLLKIHRAFNEHVAVKSGAFYAATKKFNGQQDVLQSLLKKVKAYVTEVDKGPDARAGTVADLEKQIAAQATEIAGEDIAFPAHHAQKIADELHRVLHVFFSGDQTGK